MATFTYVKESKNQKCSLSLQELESKKSEFELVTDIEIDPKVYMDLVLYSPSKESNLGEKFSKKIEKHIDELVNDLVSELDIKQVYFFDAYSSNKEKVDIKQRVCTDNQPFLLLFCSGSFLESLYASIRNALAHGNIVRKGQFYHLYSVSSKNERNVTEKEKELSFFLKVYSLNKIKAYINVFKKYN